jgi:hypothetical protein
LQCRKDDGQILMVGDDSAAAADCVSSYGALLRQQPDAGEVVRQLAVGLLSDEFIARVAPPEINAGDLEKLAGSSAEELE